MTVRAVIIGSGGHAQMIEAVNRQLGKMGQPTCEVIAWLEAPDYQGPDRLKDLPVLLEGTRQIDILKTKGCTAFMFGIGISKAGPARWEVYELLRSKGLRPISIIHPSAIVSPEAKLGEGVYIGAHSIVQPYAQISDACIVNSGSIIEHHVVLEHNVHAAPGAIVCGNAHIGEHTLIGAGSVVIQNVHVGNAVNIGAGSTVVNDIADGLTVAGHPAKPVQAAVTV